MFRVIHALALILVLALAASCADESTSTSTAVLSAPTVGGEPAADDPLDDDLAAIEEIWRRQTTSWESGFDAGIEFWVANNYPDMGCTFDDYLASRFPDGPIEGLLIERVPDMATAVADQGWVIPGGRLEGTPAEGRVYEVSVDSRRIVPGEPVPAFTTLELHVTILDGDPYFFLGCS